MKEYFDRYSEFKDNGTVKILPFIKISETPTDKRIVYNLGKTRLDRISQTYYGTPFYGFLILLANPEFGGLEFNIKDQSILRIPFPFKQAIEEYNRQVSIYKMLYGI